MLHNVSYNFLLNRKSYQNEIWSNTSVMHDKQLTWFWLNAGDCRIVPGSFTILLKWQYSKIWPFLIVLYSPFQKNETLESLHIRLLSNWGRLLEKNLDSSPSLPNCSKYYWKLLYLLLSINWPSLVISWYVVQKIYSKMHLVWCTNTHRDVTDLVNHWMVKNTKTWIFWEWNIIFLRNKKILNLCFR